MAEHAEELLTVAEVATELRVHPNTARRLIATGEIPAARFGHQYRIRRSAITERLRELETEQVAS